MKGSRSGAGGGTAFSRRGFLATGAAGLAGACAARTLGADAPGAAPKRNVIFISVDDLNPHLGCFGHTAVLSPNIDALSRRGVRFTRTHSQWTSCLPSRASFLSGWCPDRTRVWDFSPQSRDGVMKDAIYLPQHFKNNGWTTARLDKVFHIGHDDPASWNITEEPWKDENGEFKPIWTGIELKTLGLESKVIEEGRHEKVKGEKGPYQILDCKDEELFDGRTATRAVELLEQFARDRTPFFLATGFRRPHLPWIAPKKYFDLYDPAKIPLPPPYPPGATPKAIGDDEHRKMIAHYYACITFMDAQVGRMLDALQRLGLRENTTIVLFGDQGYCLGERDTFFAKGNLWDRSTHVPLIVVEPDAKPRDVDCDRPVGLIDLYPTLVDLCGLPAPAVSFDGQSLRPLLADVKAPWRDHVISYSPEKGNKAIARSIRTAQYRYTESSTGQPMDLFDYKADPYEWNNLAADPARKDDIERFRGLIRGWMTLPGRA
jgi:uncharacterized sulfatase